MKKPGRIILSGRLPAVSRLALGSLTVSALQAGLPEKEASEIIAYAFSCGINFIDTAQYYSNYTLIRNALKLCPDPCDIVISTKTYAYSRELAAEAVEEARRMLDRDVIDIFLLHEQESYETMKGHREAYEYLLECREKGIIRAVGASTHHISLVKGLVRLKAEGIPVDICHPLYNMRGIGIADGGEEEMAAALKELHSSGTGIFAMKALAGGHLSASPEEALGFVLSKPYIDAVAVGMQSREEVDANVRFIVKGSFSKTDRKKLAGKKRALHVEEFCEGCGACVRRCASGALSLEEVTGEKEDIHGDFSSDFDITTRAGKKIFRAKADDSKCVRCGYCTKVCPVFALKIY
ncbi:MAG: aldo/keto reductase [Clostridia bacterium]|nr:aldo/keto reductase [Clostridia bacterium]